MSHSTRRPAGITVIATLVALNGVASLFEAFEIATSPMGSTAAAIPSLVIGLLLSHRAYSMWTLQRGAWLITVVLLCVKAMLAVLDVLLVRTPAGWVNLILVAVALVYLVQPRIRALFD